MKDWQEDQIEALLKIPSASELFQKVSEMAQKLGFDYCSYGIRMPLPISAPRTEVFSNYSIGWQKCYQEQNYLTVDPSVKRGGKSTIPFLWSEELFLSTPDLWEDARAHGLGFGWAQSCCDTRNISGMLTLSRSHEELSNIELNSKAAEMSWLVQMAHFGMSKCLTPKLLPESEVVLSAREIEVLRWTAEGKTSGEVADIIRISERTVNFHLNNAAVKLNANNKTSAAIRASVLGLLY